MAFKSSYHLVLVSVPKLDPERCELGVRIPRWPSSLLSTCGYVSAQVGPLKALVRGHGHKMAFKSSYHLVVVPVPKLDHGRCELGVTIARWPLRLLNTCGRVSTEVRP